LTDESFDYVIVGAGSAGCVLADRLSEDGEHTVLLLEHGGSDRSIFVQMPTALSIPMNMPKYTWPYRSEPEPAITGRYESRGDRSWTPARDRVFARPRRTTTRSPQ